MTALETGPSSTAVQRSAQMPSGEPMLSVLAKRTYQIDRYGHLEVAELQTQLIEEPQTDPEYPDVLLADIDLHPYKLRSDVIIFGHAYGIGHLRCLDAGIRIGRHQRRLAVVGERRCSLSPTGVVRISEPAPIDRVALHPSSTFGGRDHAAEARYFDLVKADPQFSESMLGVDPRAASPFRYPRNPVGRGYCIDISADALEQLAMPLLEDLGDPLTAERLLTHRANRWHRMPLPSITGFIDYSWYPRVGFFGIVPMVEFFDEPPLEVERGIAPGYLADGTGAVTPQARFDVQSGASSALQLPYLRGGEDVELRHLHPRSTVWSCRLPPAPRIFTDGRNGRLNATESVLHTVVIEPDVDRMTVIWRGCAPALRPYGPDELTKMPFRVEWKDAG